MTLTTIGSRILPFLATYLVHSTLLLGTAWMLGRFLLRGDAWRETLWRTALVGGLATSLLAQVVAWAPLRVAIPGLAVVGPEAPSGAIASGPPAQGERAAEVGRVADDEGVAQGDPAAEDERAAEDKRASEDGRSAGDDVAAAPDRNAPARPGATEQVDAASATDARAETLDPGAIENGGAVAATRADEARSTERGSSASAKTLAGAGAGRERGATATSSAGVPWTGLVLLAWIAVAALLLARLAVRRWRLARLLRHRRPVTEAELLRVLAELRRAGGVWVPVRLTCAPSISSPLVLGPRDICVPERFLTELGPEEQRAALAHELAHLARRDPAWLLAALVMERVFFFQPLHRIARRRLRDTAEYLADSWAVRLSGGRLDLARCLGEVASWVAPAEQPALAETVAMTEGGSPLLARVSRLLEGEPPREPSAALRSAAAIAMIGIATGFAPAVTAPGVAAAAAARTAVSTPAGRSTAQSEARATPPADPSPLETPGGVVPSPAGASSADLQVADPSPGSLPHTDPARTTEAGAPGAQQVTLVRAPAVGDLAARLAWAESAAPRGVRSYWVAWAVPSALPMDTHVSADSRVGLNIQVTNEPAPLLRSMRRGGRAAANVLGVMDEIRSAGDGYDILILARAERGAEGTSIDRLAVRSPLMPLVPPGPVHWLGRAGADESLRWHERLLETASDPRVGELAVEAASFHAGPAVGPFLRSVAGAPDLRRDAREEAIEGLALHPGESNLDFLVELAGTDPDEAVRAEAVETLGELEHPGAPDALRAFVRTGDAEVRAEALESLTEQVRDTALVSTLLEVALNDPEPDLRREAVELLGELPDAEAVPALRRLASESEDEEVLHEVAEQLGEVGTPEALAALDGIAQGSPYPEVVLEAVEAIADGYPAAEARPRLEEISRSHASSDVRHEALEELMDMYVSAGSGDVLLGMALGDEDPDLRRDAVERIADLPAAEAVPLLQRVAFESGDDTAERQAAESLGEVGTAEALAVLDEMLARDLGDEVGVQAVEAIAEGFSRELALPRLRRILMDHPSIQVRREALDRLADLGG